MDIKTMVSAILDQQKKDGGTQSVFFVACGGSLGALYPAKCLLETESKTLRVGYYTSNEFVHNPPAALGANAVVVTVSHGGNTPETVAAAKAGKAAGAKVIGLSFKEESELAEHCDYCIGYTYGEDKDIAGEKVMEVLKIAVEILNGVEGYAHCDAFYDGVSKIDGIVKRAQAKVEKRAEAFAAEYKDDKFIYTMGSGASWAAAYMQSICILMEMQWINSACINAGEYFHGPFEVTDHNTPFMVQVAEGKTRSLDERALDFLNRYAKRFEVLDAKDLGLSTIDANVVDYFNHSLFSNVYNVYNDKLSAARQHPLSTRRYMWKVSY